jgi:phosphate starvation-inducible protein PhoH
MSKKERKPNPNRSTFDKKTLDSLSEKYKVKPMTDGHIDLLEAIEDCEFVICTGPAGSGKALSMDSKIYTPNGFILNKDIKVGDVICTPNGTSKVTGVFPQPIKELFKITFNDGSSVECCGEHLWEVTHIQNGWTKIVDTNFIKNNYLNSNNRKVLKIGVCNPVEFKEKEYVIHPYLLGVLISEGCLKQNPRFTTSDEEVLNKAKSVLNKEYIISKVKHNSKYDYVIKKSDDNDDYKNVINDELKRLNLHGLYSYEKYIPDEYLFGNIEQRIELLRGIMDGDGTVNKTTGTPILCTTSNKLKETFIHLINSLGGTVSVSSKIPKYKYKDEILEGKLCWILSICLPNINCFSLKRKADLQKERTKYKPVRYVENVESVGEKKSQCIMIEDEKHLYLTNNFIVTHNTHLSLGKGIEYLKADKYKKLLLIRPLQECGRAIGFLPGEKDKKLAPHMLAFTDLFSKFCSPEYLQTLIDEERLVIDTCEFMRGRTFDDTYIVVDEAQNCSYPQLKMLITRVGKNSKFICVGDCTQSDLPYWQKFDDGRTLRVPYEVMIDRLDDRDDNIAIVELDQKDIVRNGLTAKIIGWMDNS